MTQAEKKEYQKAHVELYERYLASKEESENWNKYNKVCNNMIEEEKRIKYNSYNIFKNRKLEKEELTSKNENIRQLPIEIKNENIIIKFFKFIKNIFHLN